MDTFDDVREDVEDGLTEPEFDWLGETSCPDAIWERLIAISSVRKVAKKARRDDDALYALRQFAAVAIRCSQPASRNYASCQEPRWTKMGAIYMLHEVCGRSWSETERYLHFMGFDVPKLDSLKREYARWKRTEADVHRQFQQKAGYIIAGRVPADSPLAGVSSRLRDVFVVESCQHMLMLLLAVEEPVRYRDAAVFDFWWDYMPILQWHIAAAAPSERPCYFRTSECADCSRCALAIILSELGRSCRLSVNSNAVADERAEVAELIARVSKRFCADVMADLSEQS